MWNGHFSISNIDYFWIIERVGKLGDIFTCEIELQVYVSFPVAFLFLEWDNYLYSMVYNKMRDDSREK